ncbi:MAG: 4Fe-4S binding protein [Verrucomicrobia bacterium]|nr:4Fe-4S binding protein [Verrucomicrobiota bacterium]
MRKANNTLKIRRLVQLVFLFTTLLIGAQFYLFVYHLEIGSEKVMSRPPGVEAFLPISSMMTLKYWLLSGDFPLVHPAGLILFVVIALTALFLKRGFCSWVCPVGLLNEYLSKIHVLIFDKPRHVWRWLDYPLRSLKYLLALFVLWAILVQMNAPALHAFINSPYNKVADIKMLKFFVEATPLTIKVLLGLVLLSILVRNFWCRYLCPYGALLGALSWLSPWKIRRNTITCIDCEKCTKVCPMDINVHKPKTVLSDECTACLMCVAACPVNNTLSLAVPKHRWFIKPAVYAAIIIGLFLGTSLVARLFGVWQNNIITDEYRYYIQHLDDYDHARGQARQTH